MGDEIVDYIPGMAPTQIRDLPTVFHGQDLKLLQRALDTVRLVSTSLCLMFTTAYELEPEAVNALRSKYNIPVLPVGPSVPFFKFTDPAIAAATATAAASTNDYFKWLDCQPDASVLYISQGSFLSASNTQMDEIVAGIKSSGVTYLWVARGDTSSLKDRLGEKGMVVPWVDQLKVLCHPAIGGFWSHCGWNSSLEAAFSGVPVLTFPIFWDQVPNSKRIVDEWKSGWRVRKKIGLERLVSREEISELVRKFMDSEEDEIKEMRKKAKGLREACLKAVAPGGSTQVNLDAFIEHVCKLQVNRK
ncbi:UDP-glycosyltransferase 87A2-like [Prosopis cineraria]|uniref:UDP-glycosyltransferase 87A2-like n=1 Tax=Prosopis cineraria TaxID=364024 RepID=UPI002410AC5F|nr:UDP-glycosyltransferase 87A2-like [Prosopis cineraria]